MARKGFIKQGIELEGFVQDKAQITQKQSRFVHEQATQVFSEKIFPRFYLDDGKPEFPSDPHSSLGKLSNHITDVISRAVHECEHQGWVYTLIGCEPFSSTFAATHIHISIRKQPVSDDVSDLRKKLYSVQPLISLLGQNSPIASGVLRSVKDARLAFSSWSDLTRYDTNDMSHYLALAQGRKALTLECRLPSSCSFYHLLGIVAFIKTICKLDSVPIIPFEQVENTFYRTIKWGAQALVPVVSPADVGFIGLKGKKVLLPIKDLFRLFLEDNEVKEALKDTLSELPDSQSKRVLEFYDIISNGYSVSDFMIALWEKTKRRVEITNILGDVTKLSYEKKKPFWQILPTPFEYKLPQLEEKITIPELRELLKKWNLDIFNYSVDKESIDHIINTSICSIQKNETTKEILRKFVSFPSISRPALIPTGKRSQYDKIINFLLEEKVLKYSESDNIYSKGKIFPYLIQLATEEGLL